jgi:hypothetical protein
MIRVAGLAEEPHRKVRVLYLSAGRERDLDIGSYLTAFAHKQGLEVSMTEIDFPLRGVAAEHNMLDNHVLFNLKSRITKGDFDFILASPPCTTWSRAPHANNQGPAPLRNAEHPWELPGLDGPRKVEFTEGNELIQRTLSLLRAATEAKPFWLLEHPEDLGHRSNGAMPASIWHLEITRSLMEESGASTVALYQCHFGTGHKKSTRLATTAPNATCLGFLGLPQIRRDGSYSGPLPQNCGHHHPKSGMIGRVADGFQSSGSEAYPPELCAKLADFVCGHHRMG